MQTMETTNMMEGVNANLRNAGAPSDGTDAVQTVTINAFAACTLSIAFKHETATIVFAGSESNAAIDTAVTAALEALSLIGAGNVTVAVTGTTNRAIAITFTLVKGRMPITALTASATNGLTVAVVQTTTGVRATGRGAAKGSQLVDITNGIAYINTGTGDAPTWVKTGTQS